MKKILRHITATGLSIGLLLSPLAANCQAGVVSSGSGAIRGTFSFDFDTGIEGDFTLDPGVDVFWWQATSTQRGMVPLTSTFLAPLGVTRDSVHSAGIVNLGAVDFSTITPAFLQSLAYGSAPINGNDDASNLLIPGDVFAVRTSDGNYAKVEVLTYGYNLQVQWVTVAPEPSSIALFATAVLQSNQLVLSWTNANFTLQSAPAITGTFTNLPAATSPYTNALTGPQ